MSLPDRFASFFTDKISKLRLTLSSQPANSAMASPHCPPPVLPPDFSTFRHTSESEVSNLNLKFQLSQVPTSNVTPILSKPGSLKNVLQFSFLQLPTSTICLSALVISIPFSHNLSLSKLDFFSKGEISPFEK